MGFVRACGVRDLEVARGRLRGHSRFVRCAMVLWAMLLAGCGGSLMDEPIATSHSVRTAVSAPGAPAKVTSLSRRDVDRAVAAGLGYFLQRVSVEPEFAQGKFRGFRIVALTPREFWSGVDLAPGDVVTQVNGKSIEKDAEAYDVFQSLRGAPALRVAFARGGAPRELVLPIVGDATH